MSTTRYDILWIKHILYDVNISVLKIPVIDMNSINTLRAAKSLQENISTRHIDIRYK
jgi:hypothetical protein